MCFHQDQNYIIVVNKNIDICIYILWILKNIYKIHVATFTELKGKRENMRVGLQFYKIVTVSYDYRSLRISLKTIQKL